MITKSRLSVLFVVLVACSGFAAPRSTGSPNPGGGERSIAVICYHSFKGDKNQFSFSLEEVQEQIRYLREQGFTFVSFSDIMNNNVRGGRNVLVTIDDGHKTVYEAYRTVFRPNRIKPLLGIYPAIISSVDYALTWEQLRELSADGCDIAAHGYHHLKINKKLYEGNRKEFNREIVHAKEILERKLEKKVRAYIFPFGLCTDIGVENVRNAGYQYGFSITQGLFTEQKLAQDAYRLPRYLLTRENAKGLLRIIARKSPRAGEYRLAADGKPQIKERAGTAPDSRGQADARPVPQPSKARGEGVALAAPDRTHALLREQALAMIEERDRPGESTEVRPLPGMAGDDYARADVAGVKNLKSRMKAWTDVEVLKKKYISFLYRSQDSYRKFFGIIESKIRETGRGALSLFGDERK